MDLLRDVALGVLLIMATGWYIQGRRAQARLDAEIQRRLQELHRRPDRRHPQFGRVKYLEATRGEMGGRDDGSTRRDQF